MAEGLVLDLVRGQNRPYSVQGVADMLATKGVKKAQAEKALEALTEQGKLNRKEFGKTKLYIPSQEGLAALSPEETAAKAERIKQLQEECKREDDAVAALRRELASASSALTLQEIQQQIEQLTQQSQQQAQKLAQLQGGARLVSAADVAKVEKVYQTLFEAWARYRRQFRSVWDAVSEGLDGKEEALLEEIGVDSDKSVGADFEGCKAMMQPMKKVKR